jgi:hypothetical protein
MATRMGLLGAVFVQLSQGSEFMNVKAILTSAAIVIAVMAVVNRVPALSKIVNG